MTAGLEFDESGERHPLLLLCVCIEMISVDVHQQTAFQRSQIHSSTSYDARGT